MKKSSILLAAVVGLTTVAFVPADAFAQSGTVSRGSKRTTTRRTTTRRATTTHRRTTRHNNRHHSRRRSGVSIHLGLGGHYSYRSHHGRYRSHYPHYPYNSSYRHTVVHETRPQVVIVAPEPGFVMPALDCPIRTDEERSGLQQWCATPRGTRHGTHRRWYDDGVLASEGEYAYDLKIGLWTEWHANGALREEGTYKDDVRVGTWVTWGSDGQELVAVDY